MKTELLKAKILDLLIKGELTAKWREDHKDVETADILLEKIRSEKENKLNDELVAKGKKPTAKVEKKEVLKNDEPFEIPISWEWTRLGDIYNIRSAMRIHKTDWQEKGIPFFRGRDLVKLVKTGNVEPAVYITEELYNKNKEKSGVPQKNDILISAVGTIGKSYIVQGSKPFYYKDAYILCLENWFNVNSQFIKIILDTPFLQNQIHDGAMATTVEQLTIEKAKELIIPIPPLEEQKELARIAEKLLAMVDDVDGSYSNLEELSKKAKTKILDLLIKGKLTSKWRDEHKDVEAADVLLEKIRSEKEKKLNDELIAKGKKPTAKVEIKIVSKNDEPFEIPNSWKWCRLTDIISILGDGLHGTPKYDDNGEYYFINGNNLHNGKILIKSNTKTVNLTEYELYKKDLNQNTILVSINGTLGNTAFYNGEKVILGKSACYFNLFYSELKYFIFYLLNTKYFVDYANKKATGKTIKNVPLEAMRKLPIPIPPLEEQKEIVQIAETLLNQIDSLTNINSVQNGDEEDE